jgi:hypothetical protein
MRKFRSLAPRFPSAIACAAAVLAMLVYDGLAADLRHLTRPFQRPFQYVGMTVSQAAKATGTKPNSGGNIVIDTKDAHLVLEASDGVVVSNAMVEVKQTAPCQQAQSFDSAPVLKALSVDRHTLELTQRRTHAHVYQDHTHKVKVTVICSWDGAPLAVGFSRKYYGN